jgi:hypothetical protein
MEFISKPLVAAVLVVINVLRFIFGLTDKSETGGQRQRTIFAIEKLYRGKEQVLGADVLQIVGHALSFGIPEFFVSPGWNSLAPFV